LIFSNDIARMLRPLGSLWVKPIEIRGLDGWFSLRRRQMIGES
jgi:hypothetical protein